MNALARGFLWVVVALFLLFCIDFSLDRNGATLGWGMVLAGGLGIAAALEAMTGRDDL